MPAALGRAQWPHCPLDQGPRPLEAPPPLKAALTGVARAMSPLPGPSWGPLPRGGAQAFRVAVVPGSRHRCPSALDRGEKRRPTLRAPEAPAAHHGGLVLLGTRPGPGPRPPTAPAQEAAPHLRACTPGPGALACGPDSWLFWPQRAQPRLRPSPASEEARPASLRVAAGLPPRRGALRAQPSPLPGAGQKAALQPPAPRIPKFLAPPSTSRPQDGSKGVCAQPRRQAALAPQGGCLKKLPTRPTEGHPSDLRLLLVLSNRFTFSAEAPTRTQRHRAEAALKLLYKDHLRPSRGKHSRDEWKECTYRYVQTQCCTDTVL